MKRGNSANYNYGWQLYKRSLPRPTQPTAASGWDDAHEHFNTMRSNRYALV